MTEERLSPKKTPQKLPNPPILRQFLTKKRSNFKIVFLRDCVQAGIPQRSGQGMFLLLTPAKQTIPDLCCSQHLEFSLGDSTNLFGIKPHCGAVSLGFFFPGREQNQCPQHQDGSNLGYRYCR